MAGDSKERVRMGISPLIHVDLQTGRVTGAAYVQTVRGITTNGIEFRAQIGHMSKAKLNAGKEKLALERLAALEKQKKGK